MCISMLNNYTSPEERPEYDRLELNCGKSLRMVERNSHVLTRKWYVKSRARGHHSILTYTSLRDRHDGDLLGYE